MSPEINPQDKEDLAQNSQNDHGIKNGFWTV